VWRTDNGERLGTYSGPKKSVFTLDVDRASKNLLTGSGDGHVRLWEVETGNLLNEWNFDVAVVRCVKFAYNDKKFLSITDNVIGQNALIQVHELPDENGDVTSIHKKGLLTQIEEAQGVKVYKGIWTLDNENIITCTSEGNIKVYNTETSKLIKKSKLMKVLLLI